MILEFFRFELREQLRSPLLWLLAVLFAALAFGAGASDAVQIGGGIGNVYLVIGVGLFVAQFMPWIDPARLGPVSLTPYLWAFAVFVIPNLLFTGALLALLAVVTRSILWGDIGVMGFFVLYGVTATLLPDLDNVWLATLLQ